MRLILNSKFKWKEPASYYRWRRNIEKKYIPKWRYFAKYGVMFSFMSIGIFFLGYLFSSNIIKTIKISLFSGALLCMFDWIMRFEKADIWVLEDEIIYRFANSYRHFQYSKIQKIGIEHISEEKESFDLLSIIIQSGEKYSIAINPKVNKAQLMRFLGTKLNFDK